MQVGVLLAGGSLKSLPAAAQLQWRPLGDDAVWSAADGDQDLAGLQPDGAEACVLFGSVVGRVRCSSQVLAVAVTRD
jgi:hypothetical protein